MPPVICLVRGVNVGGRNLLGMATLKSVCESLGVTGVRTWLQSGNAVFRATRADAALASKIAAGIEASAGIDVAVVLRTSAELEAALAANPFPDAAAADPSHLAIVFFSRAPSKSSMEKLRAAYAGPEPMELAGRELFVHYTSGMGRSKLTNALIERHLGAPATTRNWNTAAKLLELARALED